MNLNHKSQIIFDFDGTLAQLHIDWSEWHAGVAEVARSFDATYSHEGEYLHAEVNNLIEKYGPEFRTAVWKFNEDFEQKKLTGVSPIPYALQFLKSLNATKKVFLLTSNSRLTIEPVLNQLEVTDLFEKIITRDDVSFAKPHPQPFELLGSEKAVLNQWVMIGDSDADQGFAKSVGIDFVHVSDLS